MQDTLLAYIRSAKSGIYIQSFEETRVEADLKFIVESYNASNDKPFRLFTWSCTEGLVCITDNPPTRQAETEEPMAMLNIFDALSDKAIVVARDFHGFLGDGTSPASPLLVRRVKDTLINGRTSNHVFITCGCMLRMPPELEKEMVVVEYKLPDRDQLRVVINRIAEDTGQVMDDNGKTEAMLDAASGLTTNECADAAALAVIETGEISPAVLAREKANTVKKNGILEIMESKFGIADIGGLEVLKDWLSKRRLCFTKKAKEFGLPIPKGVLAVGIPGSGKSLTAKAAASILGVPLLKLDAGRLFGSLVGSSEANMRGVIQTAEAVAPCVLLVDEIEKGFSGTQSSGQTDGGTSARVFGTFLQWMNDKSAAVFVFATANDITKLPPEFLRKGRFDELFFVDLPDKQERIDIWRLHIAKKGRNPDKFALETLSDRTEGFTGAEIEALVTEGMYAAFDGGTDLEDSLLFTAITNTVPLSRTMAQQIEGLRAWSAGRARRASALKETTTAAAAGKARKLA